MKLSIVNENEIFLNYLITDTTPEFNLPNFDNEKYKLLIGNKNNLKCITIDNLKKIFLENHTDYKVFLKQISVDNEKLIMLHAGDIDFIIKNLSISLHKNYLTFNQLPIRNNNLVFNNFIVKCNDIYDNYAIHEKFYKINVNFCNQYNNIVKNLEELSNNFNEIQDKYTKFFPNFPKLNFKLLNELENKIKNIEKSFN